MTKEKIQKQNLNDLDNNWKIDFKHILHEEQVLTDIKFTHSCGGEVIALGKATINQAYLQMANHLMYQCGNKLSLTDFNDGSNYHGYHPPVARQIEEKD